MQRIAYYVINCSSEENQAGTFHYSKPYLKEKEAVADAKKMTDDFVVVEKHHEVYDRHAWQPNFDLTDWNEQIYYQ